MISSSLNIIFYIIFTSPKNSALSTIVPIIPCVHKLSTQWHCSCTPRLSICPQVDTVSPQLVFVEEWKDTLTSMDGAVHRQHWNKSLDPKINRLYFFNDDLPYLLLNLCLLVFCWYCYLCHISHHSHHLCLVQEGQYLHCEYQFSIISKRKL